MPNPNSDRPVKEQQKKKPRKEQVPREDRRSETWLTPIAPLDAGDSQQKQPRKPLVASRDRCRPPTSAVTAGSHSASQTMSTPGRSVVGIQQRGNNAVVSSVAPQQATTSDAQRQHEQTAARPQPATGGAQRQDQSSARPQPATSGGRRQEQTDDKLYKFGAAIAEKINTSLLTPTGKCETSEGMLSYPP